MTDLEARTRVTELETALEKAERDAALSRKSAQIAYNDRDFLNSVQKQGARRVTELEGQVERYREALLAAEVALANCQNTADEYVHGIASEAYKEIQVALSPSERSAGFRPPVDDNAEYPKPGDGPVQVGPPSERSS